MKRFTGYIPAKEITINIADFASRKHLMAFMFSSILTKKMVALKY